MLFPEPLERLEALLAGVDAVVLSGGTDVALERYGGRPSPEVQPPRLERDAFEFALVPLLRERAIPVLCVCRGLQVVNVAFGGTLSKICRASSVRTTGCTISKCARTAKSAPRSLPNTWFRSTAQSALAALLGTRSFATNSMHHQAVRAVAPGLRVAGRTGDGVIEVLDADFAASVFLCRAVAPRGARARRGQRESSSAA